MKKIIIIITLIIFPQYSLCESSLIGQWYAETESEYSVRITIGINGNAKIEYRDIDADITGETTCELWQITWNKIGNRVQFKGLPCVQKYEFNLKGDDLIPIFKECKCQNTFFHNNFFKSTVTDYRKYYVERWNDYDCNNSHLTK